MKLDHYIDTHKTGISVASILSLIVKAVVISIVLLAVYEQFFK